MQVTGNGPDLEYRASPTLAAPEVCFRNAQRLDRNRGSPLEMSWGGVPQDGIPRKFDSRRADRMRREDLCQLCGTPRSDVVYVLALVGQVNTLVEMYGGAV
jgi:hypothetical protein